VVNKELFKMKNVKELGNLIRENRKNAGLSQIELAQLAGIGKTSVFDIEKGKESVKLKTLIAVLKVLNIEVIIKSPLDKNRETTG
jgi:HTH-type transcriptional regulator / antitoxin HipB